MAKFVTKEPEQVPPPKVVSLVESDSGVEVVVGDFYVVRIDNDGSMYSYAGVEADETNLKVDKDGYVRVKKE
jgi:hypothetical protein